MKAEGDAPTRDDVLDAYAMEPRHDAETLKRYLREYPRFAEELVDLSREISREPVENGEVLSESEQTFINAAWSRFVEAGAEVATNPLAALSVPESRELSKKLGVPRQVIAALREHRVIAASLPRKFLASLAAELKVATEVLRELFAGPALMEGARQYKAEGKPSSPERVPFRQLLVEANVSSADIEKLMSEEE